MTVAETPSSEFEPNIGELINAADTIRNLKVRLHHVEHDRDFYRNLRDNCREQRDDARDKLEKLAECVFTRKDCSDLARELLGRP